MYTKVMSHKFLLDPRQFTEPLSPFFWAVGSMRPTHPFFFCWDDWEMWSTRLVLLGLCLLSRLLQMTMKQNQGSGSWFTTAAHFFLSSEKLAGWKSLYISLRLCGLHRSYLKVRQWGLKNCSSERREGGCFVLILTQGSWVSIEQLTIPTTPPKHWDHRRDGFLLCFVSTVRSLGCKKDTNWSHSYRGRQWSVWGYSQNSGTIAEGWAAKFLRRHTVPDYN